MTLRGLRSPIVLLAVLSVASIALRVAFLDEPCMKPCRTAADHTLIFDEVYYVNAARVIAGIRPPAGQRYVGTPLGDDPNAEHPQGMKLVTAGLIELFGDGPFAWRIGSIVMGSLALIGMFVLARAAGAGRWPALVAAALMASDNLLLVAGRIGTLDIYAATAMIWAAALYLKRRPLLAGMVLGVGCACKEVTPYALLVFGLLEAGRLWRARARWLGFRRSARQPALRLAGSAVSTAGVFVGLLALMDKIAPPYNYSTGHLLASGPLHHISHILRFAANESSPHGPTGIASYPWGWLFDYKPIVYLNINPAEPSPGLMHIHPAVHFLGIISPPMLLLALPALGFAIAALVRPGWNWSWLQPDGAAIGGFALGDTSLVGLAWVTGTYIPYIALSLFWERTSYLYYMVIVMPGLYLALAALAVRARSHRRYVIGWIVLIGIALVIMYPLTPLP